MLDFVGLVDKVLNFLFFVLVLIGVSLAGASVGFVASATTRTSAIANLISALIYVFQMVKLNKGIITPCKKYQRRLKLIEKVASINEFAIQF